MAHLEDTRSRSAEKSVDARVKANGGLPWLSGGLLQGVLAVAALAAWEAMARAGRLSPLFFPAPSLIALKIAQLAGSGELAAQAGATLARVFTGLVLGGVSGGLTGLAMGWSRRFRVFADPFVAALHPIPKIAVLPLIMIVLGIGESSKFTVIAVSAFFPMLINAMAGVRHISPINFEVARNYGASWIKVLTRVVLPGSLPMLFAGARLALNTALLLTIAVEMVLTQNGLGSMIWMAWQTLRIEQLYASLIVISTLGVLLNGLLQCVSVRLAPWQVEREV
jgi:NitT/TauT family transport system permease protein